MKLLLYLSAEQEKQLVELSLGRKRQEVIRNLIDSAYKDAYPAYTKPKKVPEDPLLGYSFEKLCTDVANGEFINNQCILTKPNGYVITYPNLKSLQDDFIP